MSVAGKVVLITGAARGLGFEYARALGSAGARVVAGDRTDCSAAATAAGNGALPVTLDVTDPASCEQMAAHGGQVRVVGYEPIFRVADVERAVNHYKRLGFGTEYHDATYAFARLGQITLHLAHDDGQPHQIAALYIHVDDADQLAENWRKAGMEVTGPANEDYGKREGKHVDDVERLNEPRHCEHEEHPGEQRKKREMPTPRRTADRRSRCTRATRRASRLSCPSCAGRRSVRRSEW